MFWYRPATTTYAYDRTDELVEQVAVRVRTHSG
jgi:hypothetical protein